MKVSTFRDAQYINGTICLSHFAINTLSTFRVSQFINDSLSDFRVSQCNTGTISFFRISLNAS